MGKSSLPLIPDTVSEVAQAYTTANLNDSSALIECNVLQGLQINHWNGVSQFSSITFA
jgi:hypothetical protein